MPELEDVAAGDPYVSTRTRRRAPRAVGPPGRSRARGGKVPNEARSTRRITIHDVLLMTALLLVLVDRVQLRIPLVLDPPRLVG